MSEVNVLIVQDGLVKPTAVDFHRFLEMVQDDDSSVVHPTSVPNGMPWELFVQLDRPEMPCLGFNDAAKKEDIEKFVKMSRAIQGVDPFWAKLDDPTDEDEFFFGYGLTVDFSEGEYIHSPAGSRWIGLRNAARRRDDWVPEVAFHPLGDEQFVLYEYDTGYVHEFDADQLAGYLSNTYDSWDTVHVNRVPRLKVELPPVFEAIAEVNLGRKIKALRKEDKITDLRSTLLELGGQSQGKTAEELANQIQETLHEIAEHNDVADTLVAFRPIEGDRELGPLVSRPEGWRDGYDFHQQIGAMARENGGVISPREPLLSRVKNLVLVSPLLDNRDVTS